MHLLPQMEVLEVSLVQISRFLICSLCNLMWSDKSAAEGNFSLQLSSKWHLNPSCIVMGVNINWSGSMHCNVDQKITNCQCFFFTHHQFFLVVDSTALSNSGLLLVVPFQKQNHQSSIVVERVSIEGPDPYRDLFGSRLGHISLALGDRFWLFIQTLNNAKKSFYSIFNSKENSKYSFKEFIHSIRKKLFKIGGHIGKIKPRGTTSWN